MNDQEMLVSGTCSCYSSLGDAKDEEMTGGLKRGCARLVANGDF